MMEGSVHFRRTLAARILGLLGAASLAAPACVLGPDPTLQNLGGAGGTGGASGTGGMVGTDGGTGGATTAMSTGTSGIDGGIPIWDSQACFALPAGMSTCPTYEPDILKALQAVSCGDAGIWDPTKVDYGPSLDGGRCCYWVQTQLCTSGGRPYLVEDRAQVATAERGAGARGWSEGERPCLEGLGPVERASLAEAWAGDALLEHASVASFSRFSLALLAAGAPGELVEATHRAALDEVRHARLCFALASAYAGEEMAPGPFPLGASVSVGASLAEIAVSTVKEGCIGETVAAVVAAEQLARATDPAVRAALAQIAEDEARHAELAWRTVVWAMDSGGSVVRAAVEEALREALSPCGRDRPPVIATAAASSAMEAHGRLGPVALARAAASAMADVVAPAARTLLQGVAACRSERAIAGAT